MRLNVGRVLADVGWKEAIKEAGGTKGGKSKERLALTKEGLKGILKNMAKDGDRDVEYYARIASAGDGGGRGGGTLGSVGSF